MEEPIRWRTSAKIRKNRNASLATPHKLMLLMMVCSCVGCLRARHGRGACPAIEVTAVGDVQSDSTRSVALNDGTVFLNRTPLVTNADVTGANASLTEGQWVLNLSLTDDAARRIKEFSQQNVGRTVAFLVDGKVRRTPRILDPIRGNGFLIGGFERQEAERLATGISNSCKR